MVKLNHGGRDPCRGSTSSAKSNRIGLDDIILNTKLAKFLNLFGFKNPKSLLLQM